MNSGQKLKGNYEGCFARLKCNKVTAADTQFQVRLEKTAEKIRYSQANQQ